jgi:acyl-[acyl-carrier-protein]-phospholipid O-acyltransferase/long-chain-fatty-acid--[acyl-carrier-protein] ligase
MQHSPPPAFTQWIVRFVGKALARLLYRVTPHGVDRLPKGGFLLLPNHLTWVDAFILSLACPRPIRFIIYEDFYNERRLQPFLRALGCVPISEKRAKDAIRVASDLLKAGEIVCIFPEGELSRSGTLLRLRRGYEIIARQAKVPVVTAWMDQLWGSIFSFRGGKFFWKWPERWPRYEVTVAFSEPIPAREADIATVRQHLLNLGEFCYTRRPFLRGHLAHACLRGLKRHPRDVAVLDGMDGSSLTRSRLLAAGLALARWVRANVREQRVGIVLPAGKGAVLANLGVLLAGKVPVNLNFTAGAAAIEACIRKAGVRCCFTAGLVKDKLKEFPWPERVELLENLVPALKSSIVKWLLLSRLLSANLLARLAGVPRSGDARPAGPKEVPPSGEALLLFTSGSSGEPKGVALTHRNLLANTNQFGEMLNLHHGDVVLGALPFFHSFGATVCLLFPIVDVLKVVTYPNPLDAAKCAKLIAEHGVTLMLATPTFLRGYMKRAQPEQLRSVTLVVTGAEKLPDELASAFHARFGIEVMQGYGLTETSPAASFNLPDPPGVQQPSHRKGSCGKLVPGLAACIREPETGAPLSLHETGMLWFKGANVFTGYLDDPARTAEVLEADGWFRTGDLARFDEDGFLFIEGRMSRFSKIGGEMVPHETVEAKIVEALGLNIEGERVVAITAVPDEAKGEALVLLSTRELDARTLREQLSEAGLVNLWIPKRILRVEKIPILASGKLDLQACRKLAEESERAGKP